MCLRRQPHSCGAASRRCSAEAKCLVLLEAENAATKQRSRDRGLIVSSRLLAAARRQKDPARPACWLQPGDTRDATPKHQKPADAAARGLLLLRGAAAARLRRETRQTAAAPRLKPSRGQGFTCRVEASLTDWWGCKRFSTPIRERSTREGPRVSLGIDCSCFRAACPRALPGVSALQQLRPRGKAKSFTHASSETVIAMYMCCCLLPWSREATSHAPSNEA